MSTSVTLAEQTTKRNGKSYTYWVIRWRASDGRRLGKTLGADRRDLEEAGRKAASAEGIGA